MFQKNPLVSNMVEKLFVHTKGLPLGTMVSHEDIQQRTGLVYGTQQWHVVIQKWKRRMLNEVSVCVWSENRRGYKLLSRQEQLQIPAKCRILKAKKQLKMAFREVEKIPPEELSVHQQYIRRHRLENLLSAKSNLEVTAEINHQLDAPTVSGIPRMKADVRSEVH